MRTTSAGILVTATFLLCASCVLAAPLSIGFVAPDEGIRIPDVLLARADQVIQ